MEILKQIEDPRSYHGKEYQLHHILYFTILAILANAKTYTDIETFIKIHYQKLKEIFHLKWRHPPDVSAIRKIIVAISPAEIERAFRKDAQKMEFHPEGLVKQVCFDGKTLRGSFSHTKDKRAEGVFMAFSVHDNLVLGHIPIGPDKEHEIEAFQDFLRDLNLKNVVVTADAIHCQKKHFSAPMSQNLF
jgi:hypothetical protein